MIRTATGTPLAVARGLTGAAIGILIGALALAAQLAQHDVEPSAVRATALLVLALIPVAVVLGHAGIVVWLWPEARAQYEREHGPWRAQRRTPRHRRGT